MNEEPKLRIALGWNSGPYAEFYEAEDGTTHCRIAEVPADLWKRYNDAEKLFRQLEDEIEAYASPKTAT